MKSGLATFATLFAGLILAIVVLVVVVLPAEYSLDPLGSGQALGLLGLADAPPVAVREEQRAHAADRAEFVLAPFESVEYSYLMDVGASMVFSWQASSELVFNLHSSPNLPPAGQPSDYAESFSAGRAPAAQGTYTATFSGRHGWFWENRSQEEVTLNLVASGFLRKPLRSSVSGQEMRQLTPVFGILK